MNEPQEHLTELLGRWRAGDAAATDDLFQLVHHDLRRIAANLFRGERGNHTLQPTAVVNEAFVRLLGLRDMEWQNRQHFFSFAATSMRRVLVDHARGRDAEKRGGNWIRTEIPGSLGDWTDPVDVLALEHALTELEKIDPERAELVSLRFFAGMSIDEVAEMTGVSRRTVMRRWQITKAWLQTALEKGGDASS